MDLIERLRPRWRHPDPLVRAAAVGEMGRADHERLAALAEHDPDARVRRLAVGKLDDAETLERVAASDADPALRELAGERLREVRVGRACSAGEVSGCEAALAGLADPRSLAAVASGAAHESIRHAALARVTSVRALRDIARSAPDPGLRRAALERIDDAAVLRALAENHDAPKDLRQQARERLAALSGGRLPVDAKEGRARQLELSVLVHALRADADVMAAAARVSEAEREWREIARDVEPRADVAEAFREACAAILAAAAQLDRRRAEFAQARTALEESLALRATLCERVEALDGAEALRELAESRAAWDCLPPVPDEHGAPLARRFGAAVRACEDRYRRWLAQASLHARLAALVEEAEALAESSSPPARKAWNDLQQRWSALEPSVPATDDTAALRQRFAAVKERRQRRREEAARQLDEERRRNVARLEALCTRLGEMAEAETLKPSAARRQLEAADTALRDLGPLPAAERRAAWTERLAGARERLVRRLAEVETTEEWRRWANAAAQEVIIRRVETLLEANDLVEGTRQLGRLQQEWQEVATASPDRARILWQRFQTVRNELRKRCEAFMVENLAKKRALCEQAAALGDSTAWKETAEQLRRLQAEWKTIGPVPGRHAEALWQQFREPCDRFFARRTEHFERADGERRENAARKAALCERAEALADSTDWDATAAALRGLQADWKRIGPAPHAENEALWQRLRTACDRFFDRHRRRDELAREAASDRARAICDELEALAASLGGDDSSPPGAIAERVDGAWGEWLRLGVVALPGGVALEDRWRAVCERIATTDPACLRGTKLDPEATRTRREKLCARLEELVASAGDTPRTMSLQEMALALRDRLATNTIAKGTGRGADRRRDAAQEVERIGAAWVRLGPVLGEDGRALAERFERARARLGEVVKQG